MHPNTALGLIKILENVIQVTKAQDKDKHLQDLIQELNEDIRDYEEARVDFQRAVQMNLPLEDVPLVNASKAYPVQLELPFGKEQA